MYSKVAVGVDSTTEMWAQAQFGRAYCYHMLGQDQRAHEVINMVKVVAPAMGNPQLKKKVDDLEKQLK